MVMSTEDVGKVLTLLRVSGQSGVLTLAPTAHTEQATWLATCVLREGNLLSCQVTRRSDGAQFTGSQALAWLSQQPQIFWDLHPSVVVQPGEGRADAPLPGVCMPRLNGREVPQRTALGESMSVRMMAREQRVVFVLLDGHRSKADLRRLLPTRQDLDQVLEELFRQGLITCS